MKNIFKPSKKPILIAEISGNHSGNKKRFLNLIKSACLNGADMIKIQTYEPKDITLKSKKKAFKIKSGIWKNKYLWDLYLNAHTPFRWHYDAFKLAKKYKKILFSSPFSIRSVDLLEKLNVKVYKIASFEITDFKLIEYIASKKKPIIISTGMAEIKDIKNALAIINKFHKNVIIMHCVSKYPTKLEDINLNRIKELQKKFKNYKIGLSDHTDNIISSIAASRMGIVAIEKHFNLDNKKTTDSKFSIGPQKLKELSKILSDLFQSRAKISVKKNGSLINLKRSIYAVKDIKKGEKITTSNVDTLRPKIGLCSSNFFKILGRKSKKNIKSGSPIFKNSFY